MTPTIPEAAVQTATLWCVNIKGPDDIISAPDHLSAVRMANTFNAWWLDLITKAPLTDNHPRMWAEPIEWPYSEGHGEDVTDPNNEYQWLRELTEQIPSPRAQALEEAARAICITYGQDPDDYASICDICGPNNEPRPQWHLYIEQAEAAIRAISSHPASPDMGVERPVEGGCKTLDDGRPCSMDEFMSALFNENVDEFDVSEAAASWVNGNWKEALSYLSDVPPHWRPLPQAPGVAV